MAEIIQLFLYARRLIWRVDVTVLPQKRRHSGKGHATNEGRITQSRMYMQLGAAGDVQHKLFGSALVFDALP